MGLLSWFQSLFSTRAKALSMYRSGVAKANKKDYQGAIADYSEAIGSADIPTDVKAAADLAAMLKIPGLPENIVTQARRRRERLRRRSGDEGNGGS